MVENSNRMEMFTSDLARSVCSNMILVTGTGRSGTTIMGKLIHSMDGVEYCFEPPFFDTLLPSIQHIDLGYFKILFEAYCFEDLLVGQLTGRAFNMNEKDDSCILHAKPPAFVEERQKKSWRKTEIVEMAKTTRLAVKQPELTSFVPYLRAAYNDLTSIIMCRRANATIQSVLEKSWFSDLTLSNTSLVHLSRDPLFTVPMWVEPDFIEQWRSSTELERAAYYYIRVSQCHDDQSIVVGYERLLDEPEDTLRKLATKIGLQFGPLTSALIDRTVAQSGEPNDWLSELSAQTRDVILEIEAQNDTAAW